MTFPCAYGLRSILILDRSADVKIGCWLPFPICSCLARNNRKRVGEEAMTEQKVGPFRDSRVQFGIQPGAVSRPRRAAGTAEASQKNCHLWRAPLWHQAFAIVSTLSSSKTEDATHVGPSIQDSFDHSITKHRHFWL